MQNPLVAIRKEKGFTATDIGVIARVSPITIQRIETGVLANVTPAVLDVLERWGYDRVKFQKDYDEWKDYKIQQLEASIG